MSRAYLLINQITDQTQNWTTLIQVVERPPVQPSKNNPSTLYRRYLLTDEQGTKVSAVVYNAVIEDFEELLLPYKRYYLSGAKVRPEVPLYQVGDYKYNWLIVSGTNVEEYQESLPPQLPCQIDINTFADIHKYADTDNPRSLLGIVVHAFPVRTLGKQNKTRDLVIVNQEEKPMLLTLWNQFEKDAGIHLANTMSAGNVLLAMRVKVSTFNGLSLSTKVGACLMINPPIAAAATLKQWYIDNKDHISRLVQEQAYRNTDKLTPMPEMNDIINIQDAFAAMKYVKTCWISGKIKFVQDNRPLWTTTCHICRKNYNMLPNTTMKCRVCREDSHVEARCRLPVVVEDKTGTMNAVIYGSDAERLIPYSESELYEADQQGRDLTKQIAASLARHQVVCFIKQSESAYQTIVKFYTVGMQVGQANASEVESSGKETITATPSKPIEPSLFSPTLKNVLESVAMKIEKMPTIPTPESSTKRRINFDDQQVTAQTTSSTTTQSSSQPILQTTHKPATSPSKKSRPKMD